MAGYDNRLWEEVPLAQRKAVVDFYNSYYNTEPVPISFEQCEAQWCGCRWVTIYYTFGVAY